MNMKPADTTIEAMRKQIEILRLMGSEARLKMAFDLSDNLRSIAETGVRERHSDYSEQQIKREVLRLTIGDRLYVEVFGEKTKIE